MTIITDLNFFDTVYLKNDPEQLPRTVTNLEISPASNGNYSVVYLISLVAESTRHYREELTLEKDEIKIIS